MVYNDRVRTPRDKEEDHPAEKQIYSEMAEENEWGGYKFDLLQLAGPNDHQACYYGYVHHERRMR